MRVLRAPRFALPALIGLQWGVAVALAVSVPHNGWLWFQGGDQTWYFTSAWALAEGKLPITPQAGFGWPFLTAPIAGFVDGDLLAGLPFVVLLNVLVLLPIAVACVYGIASRLGGRTLGLVAAAMFALAPIAAVPLFDDRYYPKYVEQFLPQALGFSAMADFPSMVALLVAAYFSVRLFDRTGPALADGVLAGLAAGLAIAIKPSNGLFLPALGLALLAARNARAALPVAGGLLPALVTLAVWKYRGTGGIPVLALEHARAAASAGGIADFVRKFDLDLSNLRKNHDLVREYFWSVRVLQWVPLAGFVGLARRSLPGAVLVFGWLAAFVLVKGSSGYASVETGSFFRFLVPAYPAFVLLLAAVPLCVPRLADRLRRPRLRLPAGSTRRIAALGAFAAIGLVPLVLVMAADPLDEPRALYDRRQNLLLAVRDFDLVAAPAGGAVRLAWKSDRDEVVAYRIYRAASDPRDHCVEVETGPLDCTFDMQEIGTVRETTFLDRAPPGRWYYRLGLLAGYRGSRDYGDLMFVSEVARADVA